MNSHISTYKELLDEKEMLERSLATQRNLIRANINALKSQIKPISQLSRNVNGYTSQGKMNFLFTVVGPEVGMFIVRKIIIARSGWLGKIILPRFFSLFTPHFLKHQVTHFFKRLKGVIKLDKPFDQRKSAIQPVRH